MGTLRRTISPYEQQPLRPRDPYTASKAAAELLCYQYSQTSAFDIVLARPFNHIGPGQSPRARRNCDVLEGRARTVKRALITGITGQDGSYLAELLLEKGYVVSGVVRRASTESFERIEHLRDRLQLLQGDLLDQSSLLTALEQSQPDEVYNLAAQSFVPTSWNQAVLTSEFTYRTRGDAFVGGDSSLQSRHSFLPGVQQ